MQIHKANRLISIFSIFIITLIAITACGTKKQIISQGKTIDTESVSQIQKGMSKEQIRIVLGSPSIIDSFTGNTWIYYYSKSNINENDADKKGKLVLGFTQNQLTEVSGGSGIIVNKEVEKGGTVITKPTLKERGIFN